MSSNKSGRLFVFAAPSGAGKTTLVHAIVTKHPELRFSISYTTREPRINEANAVDYLFVSEDEFMRLRDADEMLEYAQVFDNHYATSRSQVEKHLADDRSVVLEIDWQGAQQVRKQFECSTNVFILPPSREELLSRLQERGQDSQDVIQKRMDEAIEQMSHYKEFEYLIVNDQFSHALGELKALIYAFRLRQTSQCRRHHELIDTLLGS